MKLSTAKLNNGNPDAGIERLCSQYGRSNAMRRSQARNNFD